MSLTKAALNNATGVGIVLGIITFLGIFSLTQLPIQLFPDIERPQISIQTAWRAASPQEVESELLEPQEEVLQGIPGLQALVSSANQGGSWINLEFGLETDMQKTLIDVISRMNRIPPLPRDALSPTIQMGGNDGPALTYFFLQRLPGNSQEIGDFVTFFEDVVRTQLESIPGVSGVRMESGTGGAEEFQIVFDPYRAAELGINLNNITGTLGASNNVSGGFVDVGRRKYTVRFEGKYNPDSMGELILEWRDGSPIRLRDIAQIAIQRADTSNIGLQNGNQAISIRINRESEANVLATLERVKAKVAEINTQVLADKKLTMVQSFDASVFIYRAINLVTSNLFVGVILAIGVLWWFMRQMRATLIVALSIPISLLSTFIVLHITGRSLNVISLAGLAFSVGMVLDAAIVVLENIARTKQSMRNGIEAAEVATKQVFGALLASTATTVAIFIPVIFIKDVEGQLFADLALTIAIAVSISFVVAVSILPVIAAKWMKSDIPEDRFSVHWNKITAVIMWLTRTQKQRIVLALGLMLVPVALTVMLTPKLDYLPPVKRDAVDAFFNFPAGASDQFVKEEVVELVSERLAPYMSGEKQPALKNYYIITWPNGGTIGVRAQDQSKVNELLALMRNEILVDLPDTQAFAMQGNLFGGFGNGRSINLQLQATDSKQLFEAARIGREALRQAFPGANVQANPNLAQAEPQISLIPNDIRMMEVGMDRRSVSNIVRAMGDGLYVGEYFDGIKRMNIIFKSQKWQTPEELVATPINTPTGQTVQLGELVELQRSVGPSRIQRIDRRRTVTLSVNPPDGMSLEEAVNIIKGDVEPQIVAALPNDGAVKYAGSASSLQGAISTMGQNFIFAMLLLLILMAGLFKSLRDSLMVVLSIPLATVGGVLAIRTMNLFTFQPLDLLTMIGFIILLGLVVNNAILLVHQTRIAEKDGLSRRDAIEQALKLRLRPIFMSTLTSIFGMLPLLLMPGAGSVIYRGLAAVIVGGMCISTLFTLLLLPTLLQLSVSRNVLSRGAGVGALKPIKQHKALDKL